MVPDLVLQDFVVMVEFVGDAIVKDGIKIISNRFLVIFMFFFFFLSWRNV